MLIPNRISRPGLCTLPTLVATIGSKMRRSVCYSKERWAAIDASTAEQQQNGDITDEIFRRSLEQAAQNPGPAFDTP